MKSLPDDQLIEQCKNGNREAFNELIRRYQNRIYWVVRRILCDHDDALDIAQDVFVRAYQNINGFRGDSQVFTWLYKIATNLSLNHVRRKKIKRFFHSDEITERKYNPEDNPETRYERNELRMLIEKAIATLPEKQRIVFTLRYFEEMPYEEISKIMNRTVGGLKANYFHAVRKIKEYVKNAL